MRQVRIVTRHDGFVWVAELVNRLDEVEWELKGHDENVVRRDLTRRAREGGYVVLETVR